MTRPAPYALLAAFVLAACLCLGGVGCSGEERPAEPTVHDLAGALDKRLANARERIAVLRRQAEALYESASAGPAIRPSRLGNRYFAGLMYYKARDDGRCAVFATGHVPVDEVLFAEMDALDGLQADIKAAREGSDSLVLTYFLSRRDWLFAYPFFNPVSYFRPGFDFATRILAYMEAVPERNPNRQLVWIDPYVDIVGQGYIISVSAPVYHGGEFKGSVGGDINLVDFVGPSMDTDRRLLVMSSDSVVVAATPEAERLLGMQGLGPLHYFGTVEREKYAGDIYRLDLQDDRRLRTLARQVRELDRFDSQLPGGWYRAVRAVVPETGWFVVEFDPE